MDNIKLAVVGSRSITDRVFDEIFLHIRLLWLDGKNVTTIISGGARQGVDALAKEYALEHGLDYIEHPANWSDMSEPCVIKTNKRGQKYNALAGIKRNDLIVQDMDEMLAIWDGVSKGTHDVITKGVNSGKIVRQV